MLMHKHTYQIAGALILVPWLALAEGIASLNDSPKTGGGVPSNAGTINGVAAVPGPSNQGNRGETLGAGGVTGESTDSLANPTTPRVPSPTPAPSVPVPTVMGSSIGTSQEAVRDAQRALSANGFKVAQDGRMGPSTKNAIRDYQARNGLAQTGELDSDTVRALNSSTQTQQQRSTLPEGRAMEFPSGF